MNIPIKKLLIKLKNLLISKISHYTITQNYYKAVSEDKYIDGITDWVPYIQYVEKILNEENIDNMFISVYRNMFPKVHPLSILPILPIPINKKIVYNVDDTSHNIKFTFDSNNITKTINIILFYIGSNKIPEEHTYNNNNNNNNIILNKMIHKKTNITILVLDNNNNVIYTEKITVKKDPCIRKEFTEETKKNALAKYNYRCAITCIKLNEVNRYQFDHKDNMNCNNSFDNCIPLLTEIHDIKTYNVSYYNKLVNDMEELKKYKMEKIESIKESIIWI